MTREEFDDHLKSATQMAIGFARRFVTNVIPDEGIYVVLLNQSNDKRRRPDDVVFPGDDADWVRSGLSAEEVITLLYRDGRCPVWIDISVEAVLPGRALVQLLCSGRYTDNDQRLYYAASSVMPFGVKGPTFPPGLAWKGLVHNRAEQFGFVLQPKFPWIRRLANFPKFTLYEGSWQ